MNVWRLSLLALLILTVIAHAAPPTARSTRSTAPVAAPKPRPDPDAAHRELLETGGQALRGFGWASLGFTLFYLGVMSAMSLTGWLLAQRTAGPTASERLALWYGLALFLGLICFYAALPFVLVGLLVVFLVLLVLSLFVGRNSDGREAHIDMLRASGGGMKAVFRAMFARSGGGGYGVRKRREDCPRLFAAIDEVAKRADTAPPDEVWISPGADFSVYQRGRGPFGVFGSRKRVLTLGLCVLTYLSASEFKSILAHEFGHFSHADTFWHRFIFQVTLSLRTATRDMARSGWVIWVNPFFWFFWLYGKSFALLAAGFSRSREFLADRLACTLYGSDVFIAALRKVCTDGTHFERVIYKNIVRLLRQNQAFINMYLAFRKFREKVLPEEERRRLHEQWLDDQRSLFASHPTFAERTEAAAALPRAAAQENTPALQLFETPEKIEQELTDYLTHAMAGVKM